MADSTPQLTAAQVGAKLIVGLLGTMPQAQAEEMATLAGIFIGKIVSETVEDIIDKRFGNTAEIAKPNDHLQDLWAIDSHASD